MPLLNKNVSIVIVFVAQLGYTQQDTNLDSDEEDTLSEEIIFDDDLFGNVFDEPPTQENDSWLDGLTVRIRQQFYGQVNSHSIEPFPGFSLPKNAEIENNRLGINFRFQNSFAPGWLFQASGQTRAFWKDDYEYKANGNNFQ